MAMQPPPDDGRGPPNVPLPGAPPVDANAQAQDQQRQPPLPPQPGGFPPPPPPMPPPPQGAYMPGPQMPPAPPPYWVQPYPNAPPPQGPTDGKATMSLVLGIVSLVFSMCYGFGLLFSIPAIITGVMSRREIARSGGAIGGNGVAIGGIITGSVGGGVSLLQICLVVGVMIFSMSKTASYTPPPTPYPTYTAPTVTAPPTATTTATVTPPPTYVSHVTDLHASGGTLRTQLAAAYKRADVSKKKLLVMTSAAWSKEAGEIATVWGQYSIQDAVKDADVVRIDVDEFKAELKGVRMEKPDVPWFFLVGAKAEPDDAISADEWGANTAYNIAPVMRLFVHGLLKTRKTPAPAGTTL